MLCCKPVTHAQPPDCSRFMLHIAWCSTHVPAPTTTAFPQTCRAHSAPDACTRSAGRHAALHAHT
eukprot:364728-Chlamydomonas_euryale.AAC.8